MKCPVCVCGILQQERMRKKSKKFVRDKTMYFMNPYILC